MDLAEGALGREEGEDRTAFHAIEVDVFALGSIAFGDCWWDIATRLQRSKVGLVTILEQVYLAVSLLCFHGECGRCRVCFEACSK